MKTTLATEHQTKGPTQLRREPQQVVAEPVRGYAARTSYPVAAARPNRTGLPDQLKAGVENLSGHSLDDVQVHYNSTKPAQLQALAYAQGTAIHLAPGQEQHLPHEAWHVVQQKQGRVRPTMQVQGVEVNDDSRLEKEASVMSASIEEQNNFGQTSFKQAALISTAEYPIQRMILSPANSNNPDKLVRHQEDIANLELKYQEIKELISSNGFIYYSVMSFSVSNDIMREFKEFESKYALFDKDRVNNKSRGLIRGFNKTLDSILSNIPKEVKDDLQAEKTNKAKSTEKEKKDKEALEEYQKAVRANAETVIDKMRLVLDKKGSPYCTIEVITTKEKIYNSHPDDNIGKDEYREHILERVKHIFPQSNPGAKPFNNWVYKYPGPRLSNYTVNSSESVMNKSTGNTGNTALINIHFE